MVDVAVVGGGPAGCAAALTLQSRGLVTTVITSRRSRQRPTETSVPRLRQLLQALGADEALAAAEPCYGIESNWGAAAALLRPSILEVSGDAWFIHRAPFDAALLRVVESAGVVRLDAEATGVHFSEAGVIVSATTGTIEAKKLVIATGCTSWTARATCQKPVVMDTLVCYWARLDVPIESRLLHVETTESGWWYVCPGEDATALACFVTDPKSSRELAPSQPTRWYGLFRATRLCREHNLAVPVGRVHCFPIGVAALARRCGSQWAAAGDAAIKLDPVASAGTVTALESGIRAAHVILDGLRGSETSVRTYDQWSSGLVVEFRNRRTPLYAAEAAKYPNGFWARRS
jgi:2-polyprenyl-6-methoxyphenol hydroxylase-like FAD-dependent oxidoreductase